jgi:hypothetical protein
MQGGLQASCLRSGSHSLSFQFQRIPDGGQGPIATASFFLSQDYSCPSRAANSAAVTLTLTGTSGVFPELTMGIAATVSSGYSGVLQSRVDEHEWIAATFRGSDCIMNSNLTSSIQWHDSDFRDYCLPVGRHSLFLQIQSEIFGNSSIISLDFTVAWSYGCGRPAGLLAS